MKLFDIDYYDGRLICKVEQKQGFVELTVMDTKRMFPYRYKLKSMEEAYEEILSYREIYAEDLTDRERRELCS